MIDLDSDYEKARSRALRLLTVRGRSSEELRERLILAGFAGPIAEQVVDRLAEVGLIDDYCFARDFVERSHVRRLATSVVRRELEIRKVDSTVIKDALVGYGFQERARALELASKKAKSLHRVDYDVAYRRLSGFLAGRGFDAETVGDVCLATLSERPSVIDPSSDQV